MRKLMLFITLLIFPTSLTFTAVEEENEYNAIYNYKKWNCEIKNSKAIIKISNSLTIYNKRGDKYGYVTFSEDQFRKIKKCKIILKDQNQNIIGQFDKNDLFEICGFGKNYQIYNDICQYHFTPISPGYPYFLEYEYELELKTLFFLRGFQVVEDIPVNHFEGELIFPDDLTIHYRQYAMEIPRTDSIIKNKIVYQWKADDIVPLDYDTLEQINYHWGGWLSLISDHIDFADIVLKGISWKNIGKWYQQIAQNRYLDFDSNNFVSDSGNILNLIKLTYDDVCSHTRYVSVSIGESGWKPRNAKTTQSTGYGDCKDMSTLLISKLRKQGIIAYPVLVLTKDNGIIDTTFPGFGFNHIFVTALAGNDTIWMDPTCDVCPVGELPWIDQGITGLLVTDSGGIILNTPVTNYFDNSFFRETEIRIDSLLYLNINSTITMRGNAAHSSRKRLPYMNNTELIEYAEYLISESQTPIKISDTKIHNLNNKNEPLELKISGKSKRPLRKIGNKIYLDPLLFYTGIGYDDFNSGNRKRPLNINYTRIKSDSVIINWDTCLKIDSVLLPETEFESHSIGFRSSKAYLHKNSIIFLNASACKSAKIFPDDFDIFENLFQKDKEQYIKFVLNGN